MFYLFTLTDFLLIDIKFSNKVYLRIHYGVDNVNINESKKALIRLSGQVRINN